jgi:hypothetical protein
LAVGESTIVTLSGVEVRTYAASTGNATAVTSSGTLTLKACEIMAESAQGDAVGVYAVSPDAEVASISARDSQITAVVHEDGGDSTAVMAGANGSAALFNCTVSAGAQPTFGASALAETETTGSISAALSRIQGAVSTGTPTCAVSLVGTVFTENGPCGT